MRNNFFVHREGDPPTRTKWDLVANEILETWRVSLFVRFLLSLSLARTSTARARIRAEFFKIHNEYYFLFLSAGLKLRRIVSLYS